VDNPLPSSGSSEDLDASAPQPVADVRGVPAGRRGEPAAGRGQKAGRRSTSTAPGGLRIERRFTREGVHPFDEVQWERRTAAIGNEKGETVFEQRDCEVPVSWSQMATNVVVSKYFRGPLDTPRRETSVRQMISRVADTIAAWGLEGGYLAGPESARAFQDELTHLVLHQMMSFNSPVWFNVGVPGTRPQASACFINSVEDTMDSILKLAHTEGMLFKYGSGTGTNLSPIRSSQEALAGGGAASGPVSFMRGFDAFAGVIKSGGTTRRAAKMVILNVDHPDIREFITCKVTEERKAWALIDAGYDGAFTGEAYASIFFQNSNNSVRVTDDFMRAVIEDRDWKLPAVTDPNRILGTIKARELMRLMAESAHQCGDPGIQYDTTINDWHTSANSARINASNPCSEFMYLDDTACNLASLNLMRFLREDGTFDVEGFRHAVSITITAMEILVSNASYPSDKIATNSERFRPLGLGYANLGALLMARGAPYDSPQGRELASCITATMTGEAYAQSARIAREVGPFAGYDENRQPMLRVIGKHREAAYRIADDHVESQLLTAARRAWDEAHELGAVHGYRNGQSTVLAPTGTIGFMMDCDTTGVEPDIALVKYKKLVGGGMLKIVNGTVPLALRRLGYGEAAVRDIVAHIDAKDTIEGAPHLREEDLAVFDCAFKPAGGARSIAWQGHVRMMGAVQPFLSGAISKTVNMPQDATVDDVERAYMDGWKMGLKALAIYRDGSKRSQPVGTTIARTTGAKQIADRPLRRRLPSERQAVTHKFEIGGHEGYITVGLYEDGTPGEIFVKMAKEGSTVSGLMDSFATAISLTLQYGVPLKVLVDKFSHARFEPSGYTGNPEIPIAKSIMDYIFRWLASRFLPWEERDALGIIRRDGTEPGDEPEVETRIVAAPAAAAAARHDVPVVSRTAPTAFLNQEDAPSCSDCGSLMVRSGACYKCLNCGGTSGCS
jgi:ribonucleoside-diphosphate reductase alpha chain